MNFFLTLLALTGLTIILTLAVSFVLAIPLRRFGIHPMAIAASLAWVELAVFFGLTIPDFSLACRQMGIAVPWPLRWIDIPVLVAVGVCICIAGFILLKDRKRKWQSAVRYLFVVPIALGILALFTAKFIPFGLNSLMH